MRACALSVEPELAGAGGRAGALPAAAVRDARGRAHAAWLRLPLLRFLVRRLASLVIVVWVVEIATFLMVRLMPGDPARAGPRPACLRSRRSRRCATSSASTGRCSPSTSTTPADALQPDFGSSFYTHLPVSQELSSRVGPEIALVGLAVSIILVLGIAHRPRRRRR